MVFIVLTKDNRRGKNNMDWLFGLPPCRCECVAGERTKKDRCFFLNHRDATSRGGGGAGVALGPPFFSCTQNLPPTPIRVFAFVCMGSLRCAHVPELRWGGRTRGWDGKERGPSFLGARSGFESEVFPRTSEKEFLFLTGCV